MQLLQFIRRTDKSLAKQLKLTICEVLNGSQGCIPMYSGEHFIIIHFSTCFNHNAVAQGESFAIKLFLVSLHSFLQVFSSSLKQTKKNQLNILPLHPEASFATWLLKVPSALTWALTAIKWWWKSSILLGVDLRTYENSIIRDFVWQIYFLF